MIHYYIIKRKNISRNFFFLVRSIFSSLNKEKQTQKVLLEKLNSKLKTQLKTQEAWHLGLGIWAFGHLGIWAFGHLALMKKKIPAKKSTSSQEKRKQKITVFRFFSFFLLRVSCQESKTKKEGLISFKNCSFDSGGP